LVHIGLFELIGARILIVVIFFYHKFYLLLIAVHSVMLVDGHSDVRGILFTILTLMKSRWLGFLCFFTVTRM
jgi:hypothetical protein